MLHRDIEGKVTKWSPFGHYLKLVGDHLLGKC